MAQDFTAGLSGRFVDDDDIVRTGRAMIEIDGYDMLHIPVPTGLRESLEANEAAIAASVETAKTAATTATSAKDAAASSATAAKTSETNAGNSASAAASSASAAAASQTGAESAKTAAESARDAAKSSASSASTAGATAGKTAAEAVVAGKANTSHTHVSADITDSSSTGDSGRGKVVRWNAAGKIETSSNPSSANDLTRKAYVDTEVAKKAAQADLVALQACLAGIIPYAVMMTGPEEGQNPIIVAGTSHQRGMNTRIGIPKGVSQVQLSTAYTGATTLVLVDGARNRDVKWWPSDPGGINMVEAVGNDAYIYLRAAGATTNDTFSLVIIPMSDQN